MFQRQWVLEVVSGHFVALLLIIIHDLNYDKSHQL